MLLIEKNNTLANRLTINNYHKTLNCFTKKDGLKFGETISTHYFCTEFKLVMSLKLDGVNS